MDNHPEILACLPHKESTGIRRANADWGKKGSGRNKICYSHFQALVVTVAFIWSKIENPGRFLVITECPNLRDKGIVVSVELVIVWRTD